MSQKITLACVLQYHNQVWPKLESYQLRRKWIDIVWKILDFNLNSIPERYKRILTDLSCLPDQFHFKFPVANRPRWPVSLSWPTRNPTLMTAPSPPFWQRRDSESIPSIIIVIFTVVNHFFHHHRNHHFSRSWILLAVWSSSWFNSTNIIITRPRPAFGRLGQSGSCGRVQVS